MSVLSAVAWEALWCWMAKKPYTVGDLSAVVTGLLLAYNLPPTVPLWLPIVGTGDCHCAGKTVLWRLGTEFYESRAGGARNSDEFLGGLDVWNGHIPWADAMTSATPLAQGAEYALDALFWGTIPGCIGRGVQTSAAGGRALFACAPRDFLARPGHDAARQFLRYFGFPWALRKRSAAGAVWRLDPGRVFHGHGLLLFSHDAGGQAHHGRGVRVGVVCDPHLQFFARRLFLCDIVHEFGHASH